jgi:hypothetical protein
VKTSDADTSPLTPLHDVPPPSTASTCSDETDIFPHDTSSSDSGDCDDRSDFDESELGEFLLDAFEGFDAAIAAMDGCLGRTLL